MLTSYGLLSAVSTLLIPQAVSIGLIPVLILRIIQVILFLISINFFRVSEFPHHLLLWVKFLKKYRCAILF